MNFMHVTFRLFFLCSESVEELLERYRAHNPLLCKQGSCPFSCFGLHWFNIAIKVVFWGWIFYQLILFKDISLLNVFFIKNFLRSISFKTVDKTYLKKRKEKGAQYLSLWVMAYLIWPFCMKDAISVWLAFLTIIF